MNTLKFLTAGNVDDGKSTLIGRLLYDSNALASDLKEFLEKNKNQEGNINLALLTDGLKAEREQGITIDVSYKYFTTNKRKYIICDSPGHIQYTRNMVTAASNCDISLILVDARNGITEQTRRHTYISYLLGIRYIILIINKMDLVDYSETVYYQIIEEFKNLKLEFDSLAFIPVSALKGENVVFPSHNMKWYKGPVLFDYLENLIIYKDTKLDDFRFPVQYIIRPYSDKYHDFRGYAGMVFCGKIKKGNEVIVLPSGMKTKIKEIYKDFKTPVEEAEVSQSIILTLEDDIDISRGDIIIGNHMPFISSEIEAQICWMSQKPLKTGMKFFLRHTTREVKAVVSQIQSRIDIQSREFSEIPVQELQMNDIGKIKLKLFSPIFYDSYTLNRNTGCFILIDGENQTVAGGIIFQNVSYEI